VFLIGTLVRVDDKTSAYIASAFWVVAAILALKD
jgi:hypothetical protein